MKKSGFTLSEVLMTLTIIGVVSAMTVPSLITSIEERELQAQAKKAYNTLQNAINMKYTLTRLTPADILSDSNIINFLAGSEAPTLKTNATSGGTGTPITAVQLPDGQIMAYYSGFVYVDVNGEDGPHFTSVTDSGSKSASGTTFTETSKLITDCSQINTTYTRGCRDVVWFQIDGLSVKPHKDHGTTQRYFTGKQ